MSKYKVDITGINTNELKVLKNDEMLKLFLEYQGGDTSKKEQIVNGNLKLVLSIIKKYNNGKHDMNDLFQIGCIGLIKAVDNFDPNYGVMFSTYAVPLILGEVKRFIRDSTQTRIARSIRDNAYKILKFKDEYLFLNGVDPTNDEICKSLEMTPYELELSLNSLKDPMSFDEPIFNDGGDTIYLADQIADIKNTNDDRDNLLSLRRALMKIKSRERSILTDRYIVGKTQSEIANELGVSQAQVSRIEKNAINNVKRLMR